jgi:hypothetical protein
MKFLRWAMILVFTVSLIVPVVAYWKDIDLPERALFENRRLASLPEMPKTLEDWRNVPRAFGDYWADHFGLRRAFVKFYTVSRYHLGVGLREKVIIGKDGWMYDGSKSSVKVMKNRPLFSEQELQSWGNYLQLQQNRADERGIPYLFVIVPGKSNVYPEFMPAYIKREPDSRTQQLLHYLAVNHPSVQVLDLTPLMLQLKQKHQIYNKQDIHWNLIGAYHSYRAWIDWLNEQGAGFTPREYGPEDIYYSSHPPDFLTKGIIYYNGLVSMLGLQQDPDFFEEQPLYRNIEERCAARTELFLGPWVNDQRPERATDQLFHADACPGKEKRLLIFRDSFTTLIEPFLSEHFSKSVYIKATPSVQMYNHFMEQAQPDFIIEQIVEKLMDRIPEQGVHY